MARLGADHFSPGVWGWAVPLAVTVLAALLRFPGMGNPHSLIFDETYYAKDAYALLNAGYELVWPENGDEDFLAGNPQPTDEGSFVVHPPLGKWLIAIGVQLFGTDTGLGWRFTPAVAGVLGAFLVAMIAQRMFRSVFLGGVAGVLTAVEGHHLVMSRVALLDIFLMVFVLAAFAALLADRYSSRRRLASWAAHAEGRSRSDGTVVGGEVPDDFRLGPVFLWRPWQLVAAVLLGCAVAVKLSGLAFIAVFGIMVILWDTQARRQVGIQHWIRSGLFYNGATAVFTVLPVVALTYLLSWSGWLFSSGGWGRQWHQDNPAEGIAVLVPGPIRSLMNYHVHAADFHRDLESGHDYASTPWTWPFMGRPVSMHYQGVDAGETYEHTGEVCQADSCSSAILDLANPLIWWSATLALIVVVALWIGRRDWRNGAILAGVLAGFAVWLAFPERTTFFFYTIAYHPFLMLAIVAVTAWVLRIGTSRRTRWGTLRTEKAIVNARQRNTVLVLCFVLLSSAVSVFFWPIWTAEVIPYDQWSLRMWIQSWI